MVGEGKLFTTKDVKQNLTFSLLESIGEDGNSEDLNALEETWRDRLQSWSPLGLNTRED